MLESMTCKARVFAALALASLHLLPAHAQPVYKCTSKSGAVTMQQTPCDVQSATGQIIQQARPTLRDAGDRPAGPALDAQPDQAAPPRRHWIVWTGNPRQDADMAAANLDAIQLLGQRCDMQLQAAQPKLADCQAFLQQTGPGGDLGRIQVRLAELASDRVAGGQVNRYALQRARSAAATIARHREYVQVALRQR